MMLLVTVCILCVNIDLDDVVVTTLCGQHLDDVVGYGFVYYVVNIDLDDVVGYGCILCGQHRLR